MITSPTRKDASAAKEELKSFWEALSCGEVYALGSDLREQFIAQAEARYALEPFIPNFANFPAAAGKRVLEIGIGMGADHIRWANARPHLLCGIDLTRRAVEITRMRLLLDGLDPCVKVADAENLPFADASFDIVYSWGVLHHSPDTQRAVNEIYRVLRNGGEARVMIYHRYSLLGAMLWVRYALFKGKPFTRIDEVYSEHLESPGTKAYTPKEARLMFRKFSNVDVSIELSPGDLLAGAAGQGHQGRVLNIARAVWPRAFVRRFLRGAGLFLLISARR